MRDTFVDYLRETLKEGMEVTFSGDQWKVAVMEDYICLQKPGSQIIIPFSAIQLIRDTEGKIFINNF